MLARQQFNIPKRVGAYSHGYYVAGLRNATYANTTPQRGANTGLYYTYSSGNTALANVTTPTVALLQHKYATYSAGIEAIANGVYSTGYFVAGAPDSRLTVTTPTVSALNDSKFYFYNNGTPTGAVNGLYSNGQNFVAGIRNLSYTTTTPVSAQDNSTFYTVATGVATAATGLYSTGAFYTAGVRNLTYTTTTPVSAKDNSTFYTVATGVATVAAGLYSNGVYGSGVRNFTYNSTIPIIATDNALFYTYLAGVPTNVASTSPALYSVAFGSGPEDVGTSESSTNSFTYLTFSTKTDSNAALSSYAPWTFEVWIYLNSYDTIIYNGIPGYPVGTMGHFLYVDASGYLVNNRTNYGYSQAAVTATSNPVPLNTWTHIVLQQNNSAGSVSFYVNGQQTTVSNALYGPYLDLPLVGSPSAPIPRIGSGFKGFMSSMRFTKAQALYSTNFTPATGIITTSSNGGATPSTLPTPANVTLLALQSSNKLADNSFTPKTIVSSGATAAAVGMF